MEEVEKAPQKIKESITKILAKTRPIVLIETPECAELVEAYLEEKIFPIKFRDDARHIAVAVINEMDAIISWNFRHILNILVKRKVNSVNLKMGYKMIDMHSPEEVIYGEMGI